MARDNKRERIRGTGVSYGTVRPGRAYGISQIAVGHRLPKRDATHAVPNLLPEKGTIPQNEWDAQMLARTRKISSELYHEPIKRRGNLISTQTGASRPLGNAKPFERASTGRRRRGKNNPRYLGPA
jgi:hypothetical protein